MQTFLWSDPDFGLNNPNNYIRWDPLVYGRDEVTTSLLVNEFKTRHNLSQEHIDALRANWNTYFTDSMMFISDVAPQADCIDQQKIAYWQWAMSFITLGYASPKCNSVTKQSDTVTGYPEFYFFKQEKLLPALAKNTYLTK